MKNKFFGRIIVIAVVVVVSTLVFSCVEPVGTPSAFFVTYHANGAKVGEAPKDASSPYGGGETVTVLDKGNLAWDSNATRLFSHWNTRKDGSGYSFAPHDTFEIRKSTTLYAQWFEEYGIEIFVDGVNITSFPYYIYSFADRRVGYTTLPNSVEITVRNTGWQATGELHTGRFGGGESFFTPFPATIADIPPGGISAPFIVQPLFGAPEGIHVVSVEVFNRANGITNTFFVAFTVK